MNAATWRIGQLALVVACIGLLALSAPQRAGAADASSNATGQVLWCKSLGGTPEVIETRTNGGGVSGVTVHCKGGLNHHWSCWNMDDLANCKGGERIAFPVWADVAETPPQAQGTPPQAHAATDADDTQDTDTSKGKKNKKGKKGGKGRKK